MRLRLTIALLAVAGLSAVASAFTPAPVYREPPKSKVPDVAAAMQGLWEIDQNVMQGRMLGRRGGLVMRQTVRIRIQDHTWGYIYSNNGMDREGVKYDMGLDSRQQPATLDLKYQANVQIAERVIMKGIVKVEGDTLTFCYVHTGNPGVERPKQFAPNQAQLGWNGQMSQTMILKKVR